MNEKDDKITHLLILTKPGIALGLCHELTIRQGHEEIGLQPVAVWGVPA